MDGLEGGVTELTFSAVRRDGTTASVTARNYGQDSVPMVKNPPPAKPQRSALPLTEAQMEAIVLTAALSYYP